MVMLEGVVRGFVAASLLFGVAVGCSTLFGFEEGRRQAGVCREQADCTPAHHCLIGKCREACTSELDCQPGQRCAAAQLGASCVELEELTCAGDPECPAGLHCFSGSCRAPCATDGDCLTGQRCTSAGACVGEQLASAGGAGGEGAAGESNAGGASGSDPVGSSGGSGGSGSGREQCDEGEQRGCDEAGFFGDCAGGLQECEGGLWGPCSIEPAPRDSCEEAGDDSDCNGAPNSGCICIEGTRRSCADGGALGNCASGEQLCTDGQWSECNVQPETQDGCEPDDDANCDGQSNEGCDCIAGDIRNCSAGGLFGKCASGVQQCSSAGTWGDCSILPDASDTCESNDDANCNGVVNEGCPCTEGEIRPCSQGGLFGKCAGGTQRCNGTGSWEACDIEPSAADTCETGNDDNCNGVANEGCLCLLGATRLCGPCNDGTQTCTDGKSGGYGSCSGASQAQTYYRDRDGDGFGDADVAVSQCNGTPTGYVSNSSDCCDGDRNAHPGQTQCFTSPRSECGGYDYDCADGAQKCQVRGVNPNQCADNCAHQPGWDTLFGCPQSCGAEGHWISGWDAFCGVTSWDPNRQPCR